MEVQLPSFPSFKGKTTTDVCIVGAGIAGLTCAYTLAKQGKSVAVLDKGKVAGGQTSRTTAHLSWVLEERYYTLEEYFGEKKLKNIAESHSAAVDYIEKIVNEEGIDCDFERVDGYLFAASKDSRDELGKEFFFRSGKREKYATKRRRVLWILWVHVCTFPDKRNFMC